MIINVNSLWEAQQKLAELGINYNQIANLLVPVSDGSYGYPTTIAGIHYYFMAGACDVAYYTPIMNSLFIHDAPRQWGTEMLSKLVLT